MMLCSNPSVMLGLRTSSGKSSSTSRYRFCVPLSHAPIQCQPDQAGRQSVPELSQAGSPTLKRTITPALLYACLKVAVAPCRAW